MGGDYSDAYEFDRQRDEQHMLNNGYVRVPYEISRYLSNAQWIHEKELTVLREWLNNCPFCKLRGNDGE